MGGERARGSAPGHGLHHWRFDFQIAALHEKIAHCLYRAGTYPESASRFWRDDQIDITLAIALFLIRQAMKLFRKRAQGLAQQSYPRDFDRQFTCPRLEQVAFYANDVTEVPVFECAVIRFSSCVISDVNLDLSGHVLQGGETRLAHDSFKHHTSRNHDRYG